MIRCRTACLQHLPCFVFFTLPTWAANKNTDAIGLKDAFFNKEVHTISVRNPLSKRLLEEVLLRAKIIAHSLRALFDIGISA